MSTNDEDTTDNNLFPPGVKNPLTDLLETPAQRAQREKERQNQDLADGAIDELRRRNASHTAGAEPEPPAYPDPPAPQGDDD